MKSNVYRIQAVGEGCSILVRLSCLLVFQFKGGRVTLYLIWIPKLEETNFVFYLDWHIVDFSCNSLTTL